MYAYSLHYLSNVLQQVRNLVGAGLFTAELEEEEWAIARKYNILITHIIHLTLQSPA
jgi:hypothetical protein